MDKLWNGGPLVSLFMNNWPGVQPARLPGPWAKLSRR